MTAGLLAAFVGVLAVIFSFAAVFVVSAIAAALVCRMLGSGRPSSSRAGIVALAPVVFVSIGMVAFAISARACARASLKKR